MQSADKKVVVGMSKEFYDALKRLAEDDFRSVPSYIRHVLQEHVKKTTAG